jgi:hypothetical protein
MTYTYKINPIKVLLWTLISTTYLSIQAFANSHPHDFIDSPQETQRVLAMPLDFLIPMSLMESPLYDSKTKGAFKKRMKNYIQKIVDGTNSFYKFSNVRTKYVVNELIFLDDDAAFAYGIHAQETEDGRVKKVCNSDFSLPKILEENEQTPDVVGTVLLCFTEQNIQGSAHGHWHDETQHGAIVLNASLSTLRQARQVLSHEIGHLWKLHHVQDQRHFQKAPLPEQSELMPVPVPHNFVYPDEAKPWLMLEGNSRLKNGAPLFRRVGFAPDESHFINARVNEIIDQGLNKGMKLAQPYRKKRDVVMFYRKKHFKPYLMPQTFFARNRSLLHSGIDLNSEIHLHVSKEERNVRGKLRVFISKTHSFDYLKVKNIVDHGITMKPKTKDDVLQHLTLRKLYHAAQDSISFDLKYKLKHQSWSYTQKVTIHLED